MSSPESPADEAKPAAAIGKPFSSVRGGVRRGSTEGEFSVKKETVSTLLGYCPTTLVNQILRSDWNGDRRMECETFWAACAFVDISGFSSLASDLQSAEDISKKAHRGGMHGRGAESLTKFLNNTLRQLIEVILNHGGDIVKFAGDAMIVVWREERGATKSHVNKAEAAASACLCALACVQDLTNQAAQMMSPSRPSSTKSPGPNSPRPSKMSMSPLPGGDQQPSLNVHVGIGVGNIVGFHVGGLRNRWEYFVMGEACNQMNIAESLAKVGEVVISKATCHLLEDFSTQLGLNVSPLPPPTARAKRAQERGSGSGAQATSFFCARERKKEQAAVAPKRPQSFVLASARKWR
jgi:class 3 adenylate cyclase